MPYEYHNLSPEEQEAIVNHRLEQGYPPHTPPHPYREVGWYLLTAAHYRHQPIMDTADRRSEFRSHLLNTFWCANADIAGWVILPNHYHILVGGVSLDSVSALLKRLHGATSRAWNRADHMVGKRRVWYRFTDQWIRDERHYYQVLNYIHYNPVKHRYVSNPYSWVWSSVHAYLEHKGRDWLRSTWKKYPVENYGTGWDS